MHIASHAVFTSRASDNFVLTYCGSPSFGRVQHNVGITKFRDQPLEMLVLSACETAHGDDDAALGLCGLAVRAGTRSAFGKSETSQRER